MTQASGSKLAKQFPNDLEPINDHFATTVVLSASSLNNLKYMEPITFLALFGICTCCAFIAGYLVGNIKATFELEQTRKWWMNRQIKRERR